ncbi:MAG: hypothetical protein Q7J31_19020 [Syntrophales bacterium]|nr:hypothetical protein [Syntrophales bacterium]
MITAPFRQLTIKQRGDAAPDLEQVGAQVDAGAAPATQIAGVHRSV